MSVLASFQHGADGVRNGVRHHRWLRVLLWIAFIIVGLLVLIRLVVDPVATFFTRKGLNEAEGIKGDFQRVHVTLFGPGYEIRRIKVIEEPGGRWKEPLFYAERVKVGVDWRQLLRGRLAASARLDEPKISIIKRRPAKEEKDETKAALPDVGAALEKVIPARVDRIEVRDGEVLFKDLTAPRTPEVWLHDIEIAAENLSTRPRLSGGRPATVSLSAELGKSGKVAAFVDANPFAKKLEFAGEASVRGFEVAELHDFIAPAAKLQTPKGTFEVFAEFRAKGGLIKGGVKPVLKNVELRPVDDNLGNKLKSWLADTSLELFSDRVPDRNAVATVVPIRGRLDDPEIQLWPTVLGVVRNAFVEGISSGFSHLPPPAAGKEQGALKQATEALDDDKGPPKAQPSDAEQRAKAPAASKAAPASKTRGTGSR